MENTNIGLIEEAEINAILANIKQHRKNAKVFGWGITRNSFVGVSAFSFTVFMAVLVLILSIMVGFFVPNATINHMWRLIFVVLFLIFTVITLVSTAITVFKKIAKNDNFFLQKKVSETTKWTSFTNTLIEYKTSSLSYVADILENDVDQNPYKGGSVLGHQNKKGSLLLNIIIFVFVFYSIWVPQNNWGWGMWSAFFLSAIYTAISFFSLITADEVPEIKKYIFLIKQAISLKEK